MTGVQTCALPISTFFGNYVIIFLISSALALVLMAYFYYTMGYLSYLLLAFFLVLFLGNIWLALTNFRFKKENVITSKINSVTDGWREIIATKGLVRQLCYIVVLNIILNAGMNKFAFLSLGIDVSILQLLFLTTMYVLVVFVNFTPGALGILELVYYFSAEILLVDPTAAVFASLLIRVVNFLVLLVLGLYANRRLFPKSPK